MFANCRSASRLLLRLGAGVGGVLAALNLTAAVVASRPKLLRLFGWVSPENATPSDFGLDFEDVEYQPGSHAWWIQAPDARAAVVIVHGLETSEDPRTTDPGRRLALAAALSDAGIGSLVINLGYATGSHPYSAGRLEADDVKAAVRWINRRVLTPTALFGASAGGHSVIAAGGDDIGVFAVVTDCAFVNGAEVIVDQTAQLTSLPLSAFFMVPAFMRLLNGVGPLDLSSGPSTTVPMFHIHAGSDSAIDVSNAHRLADSTAGETWIVKGADHVECYESDPAAYLERVLGFLEQTLPARNDRISVI